MTGTPATRQTAPPGDPAWTSGPAPRAAAADCARVREARARQDRARQRAAAREAARAAKEKEHPGPSRNVTDPDSRLMPVRGGGFIQGYNMQNLVSEDGLIIATQVTDTTGDVTWLEPMLGKAQAAAALIASRRPPGWHDRHGDDVIGMVLADSGYLSEDNLTCPGPDRLIATGKTRDLEKNARGPAARPPRYAGAATAAMAERLKTEDGITAYRQRGHIAETPHGHIKQNMGFRQLSLRGTGKVTAEWNLTAAVHNLFKAITAGHLTTGALTT